MNVKLWRKTVGGNDQWYLLYTNGAELITKWCVKDGGEIQRTSKICTGTNTGKANEKTPEQQAELELIAKVTKLKKEGYVSEKEEMTDVKGVVLLSELPESFCPSKPVSDAPDSVLKNKAMYAQRKSNGYCVFFVKDINGNEKFLSRGMESLKPVYEALPFIRNYFQRIKPGQFVMTELVCKDSTGVERHKNVGSIIRTLNPTEILTKYHKFIDSGCTFSIQPFDIIFNDDVFVGNTDYLDRYSILKETGLEPPEIISYEKWADECYRETCKSLGWEGFVLRIPGEKSWIEYTLNGKPTRKGSWKDVFVKRAFAYVSKANMGKSGKHAGFYAQFETNQIDPNTRTAVAVGNAGPGCLKHEDLAMLTEKINSGVIKFPFCVEVEYRTRQESGKFEFPQIVRLAPEVPIHECVYEE